ncbi:MAG: SDR family NAD(P)-dependent oxidoreductase [Chloroflexota bacterium]
MSPEGPGGSAGGRLAGRGAIVTGSSGIAAAAAHLFAAEGARVVVLGRNADACRALCAAIGAAGGDAGYALADLEDAAATEAAVAVAAERLGRIDALFNVAGGSGRRHGDARIDAITPEGWERTLALNLRPHVTASASVVRRMRAQAPDGAGGRGAIVHMTSILAFAPDAELFPTHAYAAAKGAIVSLTTAMAAAYVRDGIRVNAVAPALVTTPMSARARGDAATLAFAARRQPLTDGFMEPDAVAHTALFLLAPESRAITGQVLRVDGGWSVTGA